MCVLLAGVRGQGRLQTERHSGGLRDPLRQPCSQRAGRREVRHGIQLDFPPWRRCASLLTLWRVHDRDASSSLLDPADGMETAEEQRVHSPPASLVPRLHMLYAKPLPHNNPLLPAAAALEDNSACKDQQ